MGRLKKKLAALLAAGTCLSSALAAAMPPVMPMAETVRGMQGTAYTVVDPSGEIKTFGVDVLGIRGTGKGDVQTVMAKAYGPVVEAAGGILQGMSGSPVYINGKLVGAVAYGFENLDPFTFFITPAEEMVKLWSLPDSKNKTWLPKVDLKQYAADQEAKREKDAEQAEPAAKADNAVKDEAAAKNEDKAKDETEAKKDEAVKDEPAAKADDAVKDDTAAKTEDKAKNEAGDKTAESGKKDTGTEAKEPKSTLFVSGFGSLGTEFLSRQLASRGISLDLATGQGSDVGVDYHASLQPGSPVGAAVLYGDFSLGATGTVTAVDGKKIVAFGHPFMHKGNVNYFMTDAQILGTVAGQPAGRKVGNIGNVIGRINQDRTAGISGVLGEFPSVVPLKVNVKDNTLSRSDSYAVQIAYDEDFLPLLSTSVVYAALNKTMDTLSASTADVHFVIRTDAVATGSFERTNMFFSNADVGQLAVGEIGDAMSVICADKEKEANILDLQVDITVDNCRKTATLVSAVPDKTEVKPGETVNFKTTIKPYRGDKETLLIPYTVPKNQHSGLMSLDVRGGGFIPIAQLLLAQQLAADTDAGAATAAAAVEDDANISTADKLRELKKTGRNNEIIISPALSALGENAKAQEKRPAKAKEEHKVALLQKKSETQKPGETKFATEYVIDNVIHTSLKVAAD